MDSVSTETSLESVFVKYNTNLKADLFPIPGEKDHPAAIQLKSPTPAPEESAANDFPGSLSSAVERLEKKLIQEALQKTGGNQRKAARILGVTERILGYKRKLYGLK